MGMSVRIDYNQDFILKACKPKSNLQIKVGLENFTKGRLIESWYILLRSRFESAPIPVFRTGKHFAERYILSIYKKTSLVLRSTETHTLKTQGKKFSWNRKRDSVDRCSYSTQEPSPGYTPCIQLLESLFGYQHIIDLGRSLQRASGLPY